MNEEQARTLAKQKILEEMNLDKKDVETLLIVALDLIFKQDDEKVISYLSEIERRLNNLKGVSKCKSH